MGHMDLNSIRFWVPKRRTMMIFFPTNRTLHSVENACTDLYRHLTSGRQLIREYYLLHRQDRWHFLSKCFPRRQWVIDSHLLLFAIEACTHVKWRGKRWPREAPLSFWMAMPQGTGCLYAMCHSHIWDPLIENASTWLVSKSTYNIYIGTLYLPTTYI